MTETGFFKWLNRINSVLFLFMLIFGLSISTYGFFLINGTSSDRTDNPRVVSQQGDKKSTQPKETLLLGNITAVSGHDVQYVLLKSKSSKKGQRPGIRNIVFFEGEKMDSHWLFDLNNYQLDLVQQLKQFSDQKKDGKTVAIYYQLRNTDSNNDGVIDQKDDLTLALSSANGQDYTEIEHGLKNVIDYSLDKESKVLTILTQSNHDLIMKKYALDSKQKIAESHITNISKKI